MTTPEELAARSAQHAAGATPPDFLAIATAAVNDHHAIQKPEELAGLLTFAHAAASRRPTPYVVLEIGSDAGGTLYAWQAIFGDTGGHVIAVDLPGGPYSTDAARTAPETHGATMIAGNSHDVSTLVAVTDALTEVGDGIMVPVDLLFIDGDHSLDGVLADVGTYGQLVRPGGLMALHDICEHPAGAARVHSVWYAIRAGEIDGWRAGAELINTPSTWGGIGIAGKAADEGSAAGRAALIETSPDGERRAVMGEWNHGG